MSTKPVNDRRAAWVLIANVVPVLVAISRPPRRRSRPRPRPTGRGHNRDTAGAGGSRGTPGAPRPRRTPDSPSYDHLLGPTGDFLLALVVVARAVLQRALRADDGAADGADVATLALVAADLEVVEHCLLGGGELVHR